MIQYLTIGDIMPVQLVDVLKTLSVNLNDNYDDYGDLNEMSADIVRYDEDSDEDFKANEN